MATPADLVPHMSALRVYARYLTRNPADADDLLSQTLLRAVEKIERSYQERDGRLASWLRTLMYHAFVDGVRRRRFERLALDALRPCATVNASQEDVIALSETIALAAPDMRETILELAESRMHVGVTHDQGQLAYLAKRVGVRPGTVRSREHRFRGSLNRHGS